MTTVRPQISERPRITAIADLHLDLWEQDGQDPLKQLHPELWTSDIIVLAGDISNHGAKKWRRLIPSVLEHVDLAKVYVLPGNHDYYGHHLDREDKLQAACDELGCHFAQQKEVRIDNRARILMCTLWTDFELGDGHIEINMHTARNRMNDYRAIRLSRDGYRRIQTADLRALHKRHLRWLENKLADGFEGDTTIVTHHAPHPNAIPHPDSDLAGAYASDLSWLMDRHRPLRWLYGHTHASAAFEISGCEVSNVSVGYPGERDLAIDPPQFIFEL